MNPETAIYIGVAIASTVLAIFIVRWTSTKKRQLFHPKNLATPRGALLGFSALFIAFGFYVHPFAVIELYAATKAWWGLNEAGNRILWYAIATGSIVAGAAGLALASRMKVPR